MAIFAIIPETSANRLGDAIRTNFPAHYVLGNNAGWLVAATGTAEEISKRLGITDSSNGTALVIEIASYFGRYNPNVWSWIKNNWDAGRNA